MVYPPVEHIDSFDKQYVLIYDPAKTIEIILQVLDPEAQFYG